MEKSIVVHPQALVDPGARIGRGTRVWAFAHVMAGARIGSECNIGDYAFVEAGARLGNHVTVKNGAQLWEGVRADDGVFIGPGCVFTNHLLPRAFYRLPKKKWLLPTRLLKGCTLGASSTILAGCTVGRYAFVAAGALVVHDVPDFALVMGSPAQFHSWRCLCGEALEFRVHQARCRCGCSFELSKSVSRVRLLHKARIFTHA